MPVIDDTDDDRDHPTTSMIAATTTPSQV